MFDLHSGFSIAAIIRIMILGVSNQSRKKHGTSWQRHVFFLKRYYKLRNSIQQDHGIRKDVTHWNSSGNWENYGNSWDLLRQNPMAATPFLDWELTRKHDGFGNIICDNH
jgi:hypothetical protein